MFADILKQFTSLSSPRFLNTAFIPSFIFWLFLILLVFGYEDIYLIVNFWSTQALINQIFLSIIFIVWIVLFSNFLYSQLSNVYRFYEGYFFLRIFGNFWHRKRLKKLSQRSWIDNNDKELNYCYPDISREEQVMPTRFGNIVKNAELYPLLRYKIDSVLLWPRLYPLLPERMINIIAQTKSSLDFLLVISFLSGFFGIFSGIYLLVFSKNWWLFLICFWGGLLVFWIAYESALNITINYGNHIRTAFDLYRYKIFQERDQYKSIIPNNEQDEWNNLAKFYSQGLK